MSLFRTSRIRHSQKVCSRLRSARRSWSGILRYECLALDVNSASRRRHTLLFQRKMIGTRHAYPLMAIHDATMHTMNQSHYQASDPHHLRLIIGADPRKRMYTYIIHRQSRASPSWHPCRDSLYNVTLRVPGCCGDVNPTPPNLIPNSSPCGRRPPCQSPAHTRTHTHTVCVRGSSLFPSHFHIRVYVPIHQHWLITLSACPTRSPRDTQNGPGRALVTSGSVRLHIPRDTTLCRINDQ